MVIKITDKELKDILDAKDKQVGVLVASIDELLQREKMIFGIMSDIAYGNVIHIQFQGESISSRDPQFHEALNSLEDRNYKTQQEIAKQFKNKIDQILQR